MGGLVIRIEDFEQTIEWNAHSATVADFMKLGNDDDPIEMIWEGKGDRHDGTIIFDPKKKQIIMNTDYFKMPERALRFWRAIGFDVTFKNLRRT